MFKEITEQELADMFGISLEQFKKECDEGIIKCFAEQHIDMDIIDKFNGVSTGYPIRVEDLKKILERSNNE